MAVASSTRKPVASKAAAAKSTPAKRIPAVARKSPILTPQQRLEVLIPPYEKYEAYVSRKLWGIPDMEVFETARSVQKNMIMYGDTGAGKSMAITAYCALYRLPLVVIECDGGIDPATFWGMLVQDPTTKVFDWVDSNVALALEHGPAVVFLDEVNFTPPRQTAAFHRALRERQFAILERNNEQRQVHDDTWFVAAYNPAGRYQGVRPLNEAFRNRWPLKVQWDYDKDVEASLTGMPVLLEMAQNLRAREEDFDTPISTNMIIEFEEICVQFSVDFAIGNFVNAFDKDEQPTLDEVLSVYKPDIVKQAADVEKGIAAAMAMMTKGAK